MNYTTSLNIVHWNCRGIRNKKAEFFDFLISNNIHIACLDETKLNSSIRFSHNQFSIYRLDNTGGIISKGGVAIVVHKSIKSDIMRSFDTEIIEALGITIRDPSNQQRLNIVAAYFTGTTTSHDYGAFIRDIRRITQRHTIILGDLNSRHSYWRCQRQNRAGQLLYNEMLRQDFEIFYPYSPTYYPGEGRTPSTLDIALSTTSTPIESITVLNDLGSDHFPVLVKIGANCPTKEYNKIRCYSKANWDKFTRHLNQHTNIHEFRFLDTPSKAGIDQRITRLTYILNEAAKISVPVVEIQPQRPVLDREIKELIKQRKATKRQLVRTGHRLVRIMYNNVKQLIERLCFLRSNKLFQNHIKSFKPNHNNNNKLWRMAAVLRGKRQQLPFLRQQDQLLLTDNDRAEALAENFISNHEITVGDRSLHRIEREVRSNVNQIKSDQDINTDSDTFAKPKEIRQIIRQLSNRKAPGDDNVTNSMLKNSPRKFIVALTYIMNACIMLSYFPDGWKNAITIPIRKPGKPADDVSSYRPISLLSSMSKILERIILHRINSHLEQSDIIPNSQFGFRSQHSTAHQLMRVVKQIRTGFRTTRSSGMVLLDLKCAFDSVWHDGLVFKMKRANFPIYLIKITQSFLANRTFRVKVNNSFSNPKAIPAGVPQGAVLSPVLFNIFMADLPQFHGCTTAQYADDVALLSTNKRAASIKKSIQKAVNAFAKYVRHWKLKLNPTKTEAVYFTRRRALRAFPRSNIKVDGHQVDWAASAKYLGAILDQKLTFKKHVDHVIEKSGKCVKMLYSLVCRNSSLHQQNKIRLVKSIFRPIMTYPAPVLCLTASTHMQRIQVFQNRLLKMGLKLPWNFATSELHKLADMECVNQFISRLSLSFEQRSRLVDNPEISTLYDE